jgi:predicted enzyme related to lactoylglutathione lyase
VRPILDGAPPEIGLAFDGMSAELAHFAINTDDVPATRSFYESVFGWRFSAWGPPDFYQIRTSPDGPVRGALQKRRELVPGQPTIGYECTMAVDDVDAVAAAVVAAGGRLLMDRTTIAGVGDLIFFVDPGGNVVGAMRYDTAAG